MSPHARRLFVLAFALCLAGATTPAAPAAAQAPPAIAEEFPTTEVFVDRTYRDVMSRPVDAGGLASWTEWLDDGNEPAAFVEHLMHSPEFSDATAPVVRLYRAVFDRVPDRGGLEFWVERRRNGMTMTRMAEFFLDSAEFADLAAADTEAEIVAAVYGRSLGRTPDAGGLDFWTGELAAGRISLAGFVATVSESPEHVALRRTEVTVSLVYLGLLRRLPEPGGLGFWSNQIDAGLGLRSFLAQTMDSAEYSARFGSTPTPALEVVTDGLTIPWDVQELPDGSILVTERGGRLLHVDGGGATEVSVDLGDLLVRRETGLMGLALDPAFATNRRFYVCQGHAPTDSVRVLRWQLAVDAASAARVGDPVVTDIPVTNGIHTGCQLAVDSSGTLFVGTGDAAVGSTPQDPTSFGGKVLAVDLATDEVSVFSSGHRNVQGLAERADGSMWAAEHGPDRDDEITRLVEGGNAGWNPVPGYNQRVPMSAAGITTAPPAWASGFPTIAVSGADWLDDSWGSWQGGLAVATLKDRNLWLFFFSPEGRFLGERLLLDTVDGGTDSRLRAVHAAVDGSLYLTTSDGGGNDRVLRVTPG